MTQDIDTDAPGYELADVPPRPMAWTGIGLAVLTVIVVLASGELVVAFSDRDSTAGAPSAIERIPLMPPGPRLQTNPPADAASYNAAMDHDLTTYAWIDRGAGIVRTPVADAMRRMTARGWPQPTADAGTNPSPAPLGEGR